MMSPVANRPGSWSLAEIQEIVVESVLAVAFLYGMDALAHLRLTVSGFLGLAAGWILCRVVASEWRRRGGPSNWMGPVWELVGPALWVTLASPYLKQPWTPPQTMYAAFFIWSAWHLWRWGLRRSEAPVGESLRWLLVGGVSLSVVAPYFTDLQLGGRDANWYTSVFIDFLHQMREGFFPVFIGQGELSSNGSANLFRSAPLCLWIGGGWDVLTWQSLSPVAIRNLAVITAAAGAGFSMYAALVKLPADESGHVASGWERWLAALCAILYVLCPAMLLCLYFYELQMTYTALLALPWVFYGNVRTLQDTRGEGYVALAAGLSLAWLAHAPLAIICMFCTTALQVGRFAFEPTAWKAQGKAALTGALLFALLSAYYFAGMSELATSEEGALSREAGFMAGMTLVIFSGIRVFYVRQWSWLAGVVLGAALVAWRLPVWLPWVLIWIGLWAAGTALLRAAHAGPATGWAALVAMATMLAAAAGAMLWTRGSTFTPDEMMMRELALVMTTRGDVFGALQEDLWKYGNTQPGWALWALIGVAGLGVARRKDLSQVLLAGVMMFLLILAIPVPLVTEFVVGFAPVQVGHTINLPMLYRLLPVAVVAGIFGGYRVLRRTRAGCRPARTLVLVMIAAGAAWSAWEIRRIVAAGYDHIANRVTTTRIFSPDNYALGRYPYLMLYTPLHYMDGKLAPWLGSRLLTPHYDMIVGPEQLAAQMEANGKKIHPLTSRQDGSAPQWLQFTPEWFVQPGETLLLRFEFDSAVNCSGWLILSSQNGYQEHLLDPNFGGTGFGAGPAASRVIAVTNSGPHIEHYRLSMKMASGNTLPRDGGTWGQLHISRYDPDKAPVKLESLLPFRARVTISEDGYLETPRQWIAGYRAWVDGRRVEPERMKSGMLGLPLKKGTHAVVLEFVGSARIWCGLGISVTAMLALLLGPIVRESGRREAFKQGWERWIQTNQS